MPDQKVKFSRLFDQAVEHRRAGRPNQAERLFRQITRDLATPQATAAQFYATISLEPASVKSISHLAKILKMAKKPDQADALLHKWADHWTETARSCRLQRNHPAEMQALIRALQLEPRHPIAQTGLSGLLLQFTSLDEIEQLLFNSIEFLAAPSATLGLLGNVFKEIGYVNLALECYSRCLDARPSPDVASNFLYTLLYDELQVPTEVAAQHRDWAQSYAQPRYPASSHFSNTKDRDRALRIGYVSGHFNDHAVALFSLPILQTHCSEQVEIFCYNNTPTTDDYTAAFRATATAWRDIATLTDAAAAAAIRADGIDILVDLSGHIAGNRLLVFARKPAPIQVTYLGYQATTGMATMDYRLTDAIADPPGDADSLYVEKLLRLAPSFFVYQPSSYAPPVASCPFEQNGFITFGSLNNPTKFSTGVIKAWAALLTGMPDAHLMLLAPTSNDTDPRLERLLHSHGIHPSRLHFVGKRPRRAYLDAYANIDIALDPFPFSGHTTTCDALWQGVPVVTLAGKTYAGRMSASTLHRANLSNFIATSIEQYVHLARAAASNLDSLKSRRQSMRHTLKTAPFSDAIGFTRSLESSYRQIWRQWTQSQ